MKMTAIPNWIRLLLSSQGPVVPSFVSLTRLLVEDLLSLTVLIKSTVTVFFAEKL